MGTYKIKVFRFNPAVDKEPKYDLYVLSFNHQPSVLEALKNIAREHDSTLSFRESCGLGKCGSCTVMINGAPVLACQTPLPEGEVTIKPLANHEIVKDLVVQRSEYQERLHAARAFHARPEYIKPDSKQPTRWPTQYRELVRCNECLSCQGVCPSFRQNDAEFPGPAVLTQMARHLNHPHNLGRGEHTAWIDGIHNCTACMACEKVCPKKAGPFTNAVVSLRSAIAGEGLTLPDSQERLAQQYNLTGSVVPLKYEPFQHQAFDPGSSSAVFMGCMLSDRYRDEGERVLDLFIQTGEKVRAIDGLVCCGGPLLWTGQREEANRAMKKNIELLVDAGIDTLITPCPGCSLTFKDNCAKIYREMTGEDLPFQVLNMTEILSQNPEDPQISIKTIKVAYHSPCHHGKAQGLTHQSLEALKYIYGIECIGVIDDCCGGMTSSSNPALAFEMSERIICEAEKLEADVLVTACISCRDNLSRAARRHKSKVKVNHLLLMDKNRDKD